MVKLATCLAAIALAVGVTAGAPALAEVSVVKVPAPTLLPGSTYAWSPIGADGAPAAALVSESTARRLATQTEAVLTSRGYRLVQDPSAADLFVVYRVLAEPDANRASAEPRGTLVLDLYDRRSGRLVYRAEKAVSRDDDSPERLNAVLLEMTRTLPL